MITPSNSLAKKTKNKKYQTKQKHPQYLYNDQVRREQNPIISQPSELGRHCCRHGNHQWPHPTTPDRPTEGSKRAGGARHQWAALPSPCLRPSLQQLNANPAITTVSCQVVHSMQGTVGAPGISTVLQEHFYCGQVTMWSRSELCIVGH